MPSTANRSIAALASQIAPGAAPDEIRLLPWGRFRATDGSGRPAGIPGWLLDESAAAALVGAARSRASAYAIDFEHQTLRAEKNGQPAPAAGWFKSLEARPGDGLYATDVSWTARAAAMIAAGEYRYISPVFSYGADGRVLALGPAALVNDPGLDGLTDLSRAALAAHFPEEVPQMKELMKALGLAEDATEAEALAALTAVKAAHSGELAALKAAAPDATKYVETAVLTAAQGELATARTELAALKAEKQQAEIDAVITEAIEAGKITPATEPHARKLAALGLAELKAFVAAQPAVVRPGETQSGGRATAAGKSQTTDADLAVMKALGLSAEQYAVGKLEA